MNYKIFYKTSIITSIVLYLLSSFITFDLMYVFNTLEELLFTNSSSRAALLTIVILKTFFDIGLSQGVYSSNKKK